MSEAVRQVNPAHRGITASGHTTGHDGAHSGSGAHHHIHHPHTSSRYIGRRMGAFIGRSAGPAYLRSLVCAKST